MKKGVVASIGIMALVAALLMLQLTTPQSVGPFGVLAFFILAYIASACMVHLALAGLVRILKGVLPKGRWLLRVEGLTSRKLYYYSSFIALAPVILLGMQSIGVVRVAEVLLLVAFQVLGCFYISRRF